MSSTFRLEADPVTDAFLEDPLLVGPTVSVRQVLQLLQERRAGAVLVSDDTSGTPTLVGIFTERDALKRMARGGPMDVPIAQVMIHPAVTISRQATVGDAIRMMADGGFRRLPVVGTDGRPTGVVSVAGILHYLVEHLPGVVYNLPPTPHHRTQEKEGA